MVSDSHAAITPPHHLELIPVDNPQQRQDQDMLCPSQLKIIVQHTRATTVTAECLFSRSCCTNSTSQHSYHAANITCIKKHSTRAVSVVVYIIHASRQHCPTQSSGLSQAFLGLKPIQVERKRKGGGGGVQPSTPAAAVGAAEACGCDSQPVDSPAGGTRSPSRFMLSVRPSSPAPQSCLRGQR